MLQSIKKGVTVSELGIEEAIQCDIIYQYSTHHYCYYFIKKDAITYSFKKWYPKHYYLANLEFLQYNQYKNSPQFFQLTPKIANYKLNPRTLQVEILYEFSGIPLICYQQNPAFQKCLSQHLVIIIRKLIQSLVNAKCVHKNITVENILYDGDLCIPKLIDIYSLVITDCLELRDVMVQLPANETNECNQNEKLDIEAIGLAMNNIINSENSNLSRNTHQPCLGKDSYSTRVTKAISMMIASKSNSITFKDILMMLPCIYYSKSLCGNTSILGFSSCLKWENPLLGKLLRVKMLSKHVTHILGINNGRYITAVVKKYNDGSKYQNSKYILNAIQLPPPSPFSRLLHFDDYSSILVTDNCGIPLTQYVMQHFKDKELFYIIIKWIKAIYNGLNEASLFHGAITPYHILITPQNEIKLISFDSSSIVTNITKEEECTDKKCGLLIDYSPPEVLYSHIHSAPSKINTFLRKIDTYMIAKSILTALSLNHNKKEQSQFFYGCDSTPQSNKDLKFITEIAIQNHEFYKISVAKIQKLEGVTESEFNEFTFLLTQMMSIDPLKRPHSQNIILQLTKLEGNKYTQIQWPNKVPYVYLINAPKLYNEGSILPSTICKFEINDAPCTLHNSYRTTEINILNLHSQCIFLNVVHNERACLFSLCGIKGANAQKAVFMYDEASTCFNKNGELSIGRINSGVTSGDEKIILAGGQGVANNESSYLNSIEIYNIVHKRSEIHTTRMKEKKINSGVCLMSNKRIYIFGGEKNEASSNTENQIYYFSSMIEVFHMLPTYYYECLSLSHQSFIGLVKPLCIEISANQILLFSGELHQGNDSTAMKSKITYDIGLDNFIYEQENENCLVPSLPIDSYNAIVLKSMCIAIPSYIESVEAPLFTISLIIKDPLQSISLS